MKPISECYSKADLKALFENLKCDQFVGLSHTEVNKRLEKYGTNELKQVEKVSFWQILLRQFQSLVIAILIAAALISLYLGEFKQSVAIWAVILINSLIGLITELKATRSMEALSKIGKTTDKVIREGVVFEITSDQLVPGDIVLMEAGDLVSADLRLLESSKLKVNEASFTGESLPVTKAHDFIPKGNQVTDLKNMLFRGTSVVNGSAKAVVVATGMSTEIGKIADLAMTTKDEKTPLELRLDILGKKLVKVAILMSIVVAIAGVIAGKESILMLEVAIALTIAAIPEGLPIVATIALARGMMIMAKKNALINRLSAVETLGATTTIFTDKTGTLTENKMSVVAYHCNDFLLYKIDPLNTLDISHIDPTLRRCIEIGALCNNAQIGVNKIGDTMEIALLEVLDKINLKREKLQEDFPHIKEDAFDFDLRMMATYHEVTSKDKKMILVAVKGAPEAVLAHCDNYLLNGQVVSLSQKHLKKWTQLNHNQSWQGTRILGLAYKYVESVEERAYQKLIFSGLVEIKDPPSQGVESVIDQCRSAGVKTIMLTGDQPGTALSIGRQVHIHRSVKDLVITGKELSECKKLSDCNEIDECYIFARVTPQQKLQLIEYYQDKGEIVAMTGDGVNDAPALKKADIGIAMGIRGTQVAKEASDVVLKDDKFTSIVAAIFQGRVIFNNIRIFVIYLISCNISEVLSVGLAAVVDLPLPIHPLQILFLNLVTDVFPALALGVGRGTAVIMQRPPRGPKEDIINSDSWWLIFSYGSIITLSVVGCLIFSLFFLQVDKNIAITMSFFTIAFAQIFHVFNMRETKSKFFVNEITKNIYIWGAIILCGILMLFTIWIPALTNILKIHKLEYFHWQVVAFFSLLPLFVIQSFKLFKNNQLIQRKTLGPFPLS